MRVALIKNGVVENVAIGSIEFFVENYPQHVVVDVTNRRCGPDLLYVDDKFIDPDTGEEF